MKKNRARRNGSIPSATPTASGIPRISVPNCGIFSIRASTSRESIRVFPLSNWTELDVWLYILAENIPIVPLYFAKEREIVLRNGSLVMHSRSQRTAASASKRSW